MSDRLFEKVSFLRIAYISLLLTFSFSPDLMQAEVQPSDGYKVIRIKDGDSVVVAPVGKEEVIKCHLYGVDAPEMAKKDKPGQLFAVEAKAELTRLLGDGTVQVLVTSRDYSGRAVCLIKSGNVDVNLAMIEKGYAWAYRKKLMKPFMEAYVSAEDRAKTEKLGLWACDNPETPWDYRERMRKRRQEDPVND
jgi:micrococcal nuclease